LSSSAFAFTKLGDFLLLAQQLESGVVDRRNSPTLGKATIATRAIAFKLSKVEELFGSIIDFGGHSTLSVDHNV